MEITETNHSTYNTTEIQRIHGVLELAKLNTSSLNPNVQALYFSDNLLTDLKLVELHKEVENELKVGKSVIIRGDKDDHAVLCTKTSTFEMKEADSSNSMLIFPCLDVLQKSQCSDWTVHSQYIASIVHSYTELRPCRPRLKRVSDLLRDNSYNGQQCEDDEHHQGHKYGFTELLAHVQASEEEIHVELQRINACLIDGKWRLLEFDFLTQVLNHILNLCDVNDWFRDGIDLTECTNQLADLYPTSIIHHVLNIYSEEKVSGDNEIIYLNETKICQFFAVLLLRHVDRFNLSEFMKVWQQSVPDPMQTHPSQLQGIALIDESCHPSVIWHYPVDDLSEQPEERFQQLFKAKDKWTLEEISHYISDLTSDSANIGTLLMKFCRTSVVNGIKYYCSKWQRR